MAALDTADTRSATAQSAMDLQTSVEGTALSTELSLASLRPRRWPLYAAMVTPVAIVAAILLWQLGGTNTVTGVKGLLPPDPNGATRPGDAVGPSNGARPSGAARTAPVVGNVAPVGSQETSNDNLASPSKVLLGVAPANAHVFMGGRDLGESPVSIDVPAGDVATVEVRHPSYETRALALDGSEGKVSIELVSKHKKKKRGKGSRKASAAAAAKASASGSEPPSPVEDKSIGGQLFVEPWAKP
jgi:hypothetical protein